MTPPLCWRCQDDLARDGYYVVVEGQAVVDGRVYEVAGRMTVTDGLIDHPPNDGSKRTVSAHWLRPLVAEAPVSEIQYDPASLDTDGGQT